MKEEWKSSFNTGASCHPSSQPAPSADASWAAWQPCPLPTPGSVSVGGGIPRVVSWRRHLQSLNRGSPRAASLHSVKAGFSWRFLTVRRTRLSPCGSSPSCWAEAWLSGIVFLPWVVRGLLSMWRGLRCSGQTELAWWHAFLLDSAAIQTFWHAPVSAWLGLGLLRWIECLPFRTFSVVKGELLETLIRNT